MKISTLIVGMAMLATGPFTVTATTVFSTDFEAGVPAEFSGAGTRTATAGYSAHGFEDFYLRNATTGNPAASTVLTLAGLPVHTDIAITFDLAIIDSWDGSTPLGGTVPPDFFNVRVDGNLVFSHTFDNFNLADQTYPDAPIVFGSNLAHTAGFPDSAYGISLVLPHSSSNLSIEWFASGAGWQGGADESWAIDNIRVVVRGEGTPVPETGSALLLLGISTLALIGAQRKNSV
jgi:hypothetical protein